MALGASKQQTHNNLYCMVYERQMSNVKEENRKFVAYTLAPETPDVECNTTVSASAHVYKY